MLRTLNKRLVRLMAKKEKITPMRPSFVCFYCGCGICDVGRLYEWSSLVKDELNVVEQ